MTKRGENISLSSYDDIFSTKESREQEKREQIVDVALNQLYPFKNHPFKVSDDEEMQKTAESIKTYGVLTPLILRPRKEGGYEIVSGHRRARAATLAGLEKVPVIIRELSDDAATILMVDANLQREYISPMEKAKAYRMKMEALKHQGKRDRATSTQLGGKSETADTTLCQVGTKLRTEDLIGKEAGDSARQVHRYIRLTELIPELQKMVEEKQIAFSPAVELSYLSKEEQKVFLDAVGAEQSTPSLSQAQRIKAASQNGECNFTNVCQILSEEKKSELDKVTLTTDVLKKYFPKSYTPKQMEDTILKLLDQWQKKRNREQTL